MFIGAHRQHARRHGRGFRQKRFYRMGEGAGGQATLDHLAKRILTPKPLYLWGDYQDWTEGSKRTHKRST